MTDFPRVPVPLALDDAFENFFPKFVDSGALLFDPYATVLLLLLLNAIASPRTQVSVLTFFV